MDTLPILASLSQAVAVVYYTSTCAYLITLYDIVYNLTYTSPPPLSLSLFLSLSVDLDIFDKFC